MFAIDGIKLPSEPGLGEKTQRRVERLTLDTAQLRDWLAANSEDRKDAKGSIRKSNRPDAHRPDL